MANEELKKALSQVRQEYKERKPQWDFFLQSYEGGQNYFTKENIFTHSREHIDDYNFRLKRAHYQNYCETIISIYTGHLFKKPIVRDMKDEEFDEFLNDVDRMGTSIDDFMKNVADLMQVLGHVFILVDKPRANGYVLTKADEMANQITPYYSIIYPQNVINWEVDQNNNFTWVRIMEQYTRQDDPFGPRRNVTIYRTFTRNEWYIHDGEGQLIDAGEHNLGIVPLVPVYNKRLKRYPLFGWSSLEDIAYINRALANLSSLLDEFIYRQCFDILTWPASGVPGEEESTGMINLSTSNVVVLPDDIGFQPQFLSPPTEPATFILEYMRELRGIMYMLAKIEAPDFEPKALSGISKEWSFHETNQSLADKADNLEWAEKKAHQIRARWMDKEWRGVVDYPDSFDIRAINEELENALQVKMYGFPPSFMAEYDKALYRKLLNKLPREVMAKIDADIEKMRSGISELDRAALEERARQAAQQITVEG